MNLIMFDYDGVIVDSLEICYTCFISASRDNGFFELSSREDFVSLFEGNLYESLKERGLNNEQINQILQSYEIKQNTRLNNLNLFPGMGEALKSIARNNKVVVITSNLSDATIEVLEKNGIDCYEDVIGAEKEKSKIKKIKKAWAKYPNLSGYYVGDTKGDMIEGKKAGTKTVGVLWGWHGKDTLCAGGADVLVSSPQELAALFPG
ncbi:MAG: HAD family hydrolase [Bacillota bacterium]